MSSIKDQIRQEIERRKKENMYVDLPMSIGRYYEDRDILAFIDSLPEEKPSENLEGAAEMAARKIYPYKVGMKGLICENSIPIYKAGFIAGAEWQREQMELDGIVTLTESDFDAEKEKASEWGYNLCKKQMMNGAVEVDVADLNGEIYNNCIEKGMTDEDKVKIIIIKDND